MQNGCGHFYNKLLTKQAVVWIWPVGQFADLCCGIVFQVLSIKSAGDYNTPCHHLLTCFLHPLKVISIPTRTQTAFSKVTYDFPSEKPNRIFLHYLSFFKFLAIHKLFFGCLFPWLLSQ